MAPTSPNKFTDRTDILLNLLIQSITEKEEIQHAYRVTQEQIDAFKTHVDLWTRWQHANIPRWKKHLESECGLDWLVLFMKHWCDAFKADPTAYLAKHSIESLV